jgi:hypothetical protein
MHAVMKIQVNKIVKKREKTVLIGGLLITSGAGCLLLFILIRVVYASKVPSPTSTTTGVVQHYKPKIVRPDKSSESATCVVSYKVENKTYSIVDTCGAEIFGLGERLGDKVEVIYQTTDPSKATVNRKWFFNFLGALSIPLFGVGFILLRKAGKMTNELSEN